MKKPSFIALVSVLIVLTLVGLAALAFPGGSDVGQLPSEKTGEDGTLEARQSDRERMDHPGRKRIDLAEKYAFADSPWINELRDLAKLFEKEDLEGVRRYISDWLQRDPEGAFLALGDMEEFIYRFKVDLPVELYAEHLKDRNPTEGFELLTDIGIQSSAVEEVFKIFLVDWWNRDSISMQAVLREREGFDSKRIFRHLISEATEQGSVDRLAQVFSSLDEADQRKTGYLDHAVGEWLEQDYDEATQFIQTLDDSPSRNRVLSRVVYASFAKNRVEDLIQNFSMISDPKERRVLVSHLSSMIDDRLAEQAEPGQAAAKGQGLEWMIQNMGLSAEEIRFLEQNSGGTQSP